MTETKPSAEVWITGIGLATSLGEGLDANWDALNQRRINVDEKNFAPYIVHPWVPVNLDTQIPKKGDQRQMEAWQRIGTYAAGLALDSAGIKGNKEILARMDMIVAAGGGERDLRARVLRHTSAAFVEDPLRVLRAFQLAARFDFTLAPETAALCRSIKTSYAELPVERVWGEWGKWAEKSQAAISFTTDDDSY